MSRTPMYDPLTSDARSSWLAGLTEACNKLCGVLDMKTATFENLDLPELYISENDRYRIYQAPLGNKLWLSNPAPVIKKNGSVITPENDGFSIDYLGGSIAFEGTNRGTQFDVFTASATYIVDQSNKISEILGSIETISQEAGKNKGAFTNASDLNSAYPVGTPGDFAIISSENAIYVWDDTAKEWVNANAKVDLTQYFTKEEVQDMVDAKQDKIVEKDIPATSTDSKQNYFYAGDKTWVDLLTKIRTCVLSGIVTNDDSQVQAADSLLVAIGKLQAQINSFIHPIVGISAPTTATEGTVGQDYINTSNGDKYRLVSVSTSGTAGKVYHWEMYGKTTLTAKTISINKFSWSNNTVTITDSFIQNGEAYGYLVAPTDFSRSEYQASGVYASAVTTNTSIVFHCETVPTENITVNICRLNGENLNGYVYNAGASGDSSKDAVTVPGGGHMTMQDILGSAPFNIEFTSEDSSDWTASDIVYDNTASGLQVSNVQQAIDKNAENILNKQPKLRGSAGQVVGFNTQGAAVAVRGWSNPNLLDNWYFADPVNQRGQTEYSGIGYTIDRWKWGTANGMAVIVDAGIEVKRTTSTRVILNQALTTDRETFQKMFSGRTVTISALFGQTLRHATLTIPTDDTSDWYPGGTVSEKVDDMYVRLSIYGSTRNFNLSFDVYVSTGGNGGGLVTAVKCEYGTQQTLAHQDADGNWVLNDPPPDKVLELLKCQRYYRVLDWGTSMYTLGFPGMVTNVAKDVVFQIPNAVSFRAIPSVSVSSDFKVLLRNHAGYIGSSAGLVPSSLRISTVPRQVPSISMTANFDGVDLGDNNVPIYVAISAGKLIFDANL